MTLLSSKGVLLATAGHLLGATTGSNPPVAIAPSQVGSLAAGTPGTYTIPVTYTAASGTATIAYAGWHRVHGTTTWLQNNGTFGSTGGTFVGLSAATSYDLRIVATNTAGSSTTDLTSGISTGAAPVVPTPTMTANRYDLVLDQSAVAPGATVTGSVIPNGLWPTTGGRAITLSNGTAVPLPTSGGAVQTFSFVAGAANEYSISSTNNAGLYDPYPAPLTVFTPNSGAAQAIAASLGSAGNRMSDNSIAPARVDNARFQRDTATGNPAGFSSAPGKGWGEVWLALGQSGPALFMRLHDALSSGAGSGVGAGTQLSPIVQVHGPFSAGTVRVLLPASANIYYADIATDAAFTNPVRIQQRFGVGVVIGKLGRSQNAQLVRGYADGAQAPTGNYPKAAVWFAGDSRYANTGGRDFNNNYWGWASHVSGTSPYSEPASTATQEMGRLIESQLGVCVGITGLAGTAGSLGFDNFVAHDGSMTTAFTDTVAASCGGKFRYFWAGSNGYWDGVDPAYPTETAAELQTRFIAWANKIALGYRACAVMGGVNGCSGTQGGDGSRIGGATRTQMIWLNVLEPSNPMVVSREDYWWCEFVGGHASQSSRVEFVRPGFRQFMMAEVAAMGGFQTASRGPRLAATGTSSQSARTVTLSYSIESGNKLNPLAMSFSDPALAVPRTASSVEIASLFALYAAGGYSGNGKPIQIDSAIINNDAHTITLKVTGSTGVVYYDSTTGPWPNGFSVHFAADFNASNGTIAPHTGALLADDRVDTANGIPYGWHMRPALDIVVS